MNMKTPKIITIDLTKYGGTGTWKGTIKQLPSGGYSSKNPSMNPAKGIRLGSKRPVGAMGGMAKKKKPMGYNIGGMAKKKVKK